jgi:hypothetical protein
VNEKHNTIVVQSRTQKIFIPKACILCSETKSSNGTLRRDIRYLGHLKHRSMPRIVNYNVVHVHQDVLESWMPPPLPPNLCVSGDPTVQTHIA